MTYASGNALADLGFGDLTDSLDLDDAEEKVDELTDGTTQLVDGSDQLYDGTVEPYREKPKIISILCRMRNIV